jgi:hypothetical protein
MKRCLSLVFAVLPALAIYACGPMTPATPEAVPAPDIAETADGFHPLTTRTGIEEIDSILEAAASGNPQALQSLIQFTNAKCTKRDGLGGPPKCREGEAEGTPVEVLPFISSEGGFLHKEEIDNWQGIDVSGLYAVYEVSPAVTAEQYYPVGERVIVLVGKDKQTSTLLRVSDGRIVRVDTIFDASPEALKTVLDREASTVLLAPPTP